MKYFVLLFLLNVDLCIGSVNLVKVDKSERRMDLLDDGKIVRSFKVALGAHPKGHKLQQGDEKTPEGIYVLDYVTPNSDYYKSMHISYPNPKDIQNAKLRGVSPGGDIMVHGQKNGFGWFSKVIQLFNWTNGCIALSNSNMDEFIRLVKVGTKIQIEW